MAPLKMIGVSFFDNFFFFLFSPIFIQFYIILPDWGALILCFKIH